MPSSNIRLSLNYFACLPVRCYLDLLAHTASLRAHISQLTNNEMNEFEYIVHWVSNAPYLISYIYEYIYCTLSLLSPKDQHDGVHYNKLLQ